MAQSILSSLLSQVSMRITNDATSLVLWANLKVKTVEIFDDSSTSDEPLQVLQAADKETIQSIQPADLESTKIINPSRVKITGFAPDLDTLEGLISSFSDLTLTCSMSSKAIIVQYLIPTSIEIEQSSEMLSAAKIIVNFEQAQSPALSAFDPSQSGDESSYGVRIQSPPSLSTSVNALYNQASKAFSTGVGLVQNAANQIIGIL